MGGLVWEALPVACAILGVDDPELLIRQLVVIRDRQEGEVRGG